MTHTPRDTAHRALIRRFKAFRQWLAEAPRSEEDQRMYLAIRRALAREVASPSPRMVTITPGQPPRVESCPWRMTPRL